VDGMPPDAVRLPTTRALRRLAVGVGAVAVLGAALAAAPATATATSPTPDRAATGLTVAVVGDIACDPDDEAAYALCKHEEVAHLVASQSPRALLVPGDVQYDDGTYNDFLASYDLSWGRFLPFTYPVPGNHEYQTADATGYYRYFAKRTSPPGYYAFTLNQWRVYALNTECTEIDCVAERDWMLRDVRAHPARCQAMFMHRPLYGSAGHGPDPDSRRFWAVGLGHDFELALAGHNHVYERFTPMNADGAVVDGGIRSFVVGTGGKELTETPATTQHGSRFVDGSHYGALFLQLQADSYAWRYLAINGSTIDSGRGVCA